VNVNFSYLRSSAGSICERQAKVMERYRSWECDFSSKKRENIF